LDGLRKASPISNN
jgi:hypothetical protein